MTKTEFLHVLDQAIDNRKGIIVYVSHPNLLDPEIIINTAKNVDEKRAYYNATYNEEMQLSRFPSIYIEHVELLS